MADLSGLLGVISGGLRGYSTGAGLDLAAKLREQAAMDELAVQKYGQFQDIREQGIIAEEDRKQQLLQQEQHKANIANILSNLPTAREAGVTLEGFEGPDLVSRLQALAPEESGQLSAALSGELGGVEYATAREQATAKAEQEGMESAAGVAKDISSAELNAARASKLRQDPAYKTSDFKFHYTTDGVFTTFFDKAAGGLVTLEVPEVTGDVRSEGGAAAAAMRSVTQHYTKVREESQMYPSRYAKLDPETGEVMTDDNGNPVVDEDKIRATAEARAKKDYSFAYGQSPGPVPGGDTEAPGGTQGFGLDVDLLRDSGLSDEEIELFVDLETGIGTQ